LPEAIFPATPRADIDEELVAILVERHREALEALTKRQSGEEEAV